MPRRINVQPGDRYGRLTVVRDAESKQYGSRSIRMMLCVCDCGTERTVALTKLREGEARSCGCASRVTHGMTDTPVYWCWAGMKRRTTPGSYAQRARPGYVGVSRDPRWDSFEEFYKDMGATWFPGACLGRYGDVGDYTAENCRWITRSENGLEREAVLRLRRANNPGGTT